MPLRFASHPDILTAFIAADTLSVSSATAGLVMWPLHRSMRAESAGSHTVARKLASLVVLGSHTVGLWCRFQ